MSKSKRYMYRKPKIQVVSNSSEIPLIIANNQAVNISGELYVDGSIHLNGTNISSTLADLATQSQAEEIIEEVFRLGFQKDEIVNAIAGVIRMQRGW